MSGALDGALAGLAWPLAVAGAWVAGELGHRWLGLPRISGYGLAGFALAAAQGGFLPDPSGGAASVLANFAFALILFELGYRINLRWLRADPWLGAASLAECGATFAAVYLVAQAFGMAELPSLLLASLAMSTSPAAVLRVVNDIGGAGQVTERVLHLSAFNCVLAVVAFKAVAGYWVLSTAGGVFQAAWSSVVVVAVSAGIGTLFGVAVPALLRAVGGRGDGATVAFALATLLLTALTHELRFSPILAALAFGLVARHRRVVFSPAQRNFGVLGDLLTVFLFVYVAATLRWQDVLAGLEVALAVVAARLLAKAGTTTLFAPLSGITRRKGMLTGLAMMPMSVFVILLLEQSRHHGLAAAPAAAALAAIVLLLEVLAPLATQRALAWAGETRAGEGR